MMSSSILLFIALTALPLASAVSSGKVEDCDARNPLYGCPIDDPAKTYALGDDGKPDHLKCGDKNRLMHWADRPARALKTYKLFAGPENAQKKEYVPGQLIEISLRTLEFERQWRGILLYAQDSKGNKVGDWEFIDRDGDQFHVACDKSVTHTSAEVKPYLSSWRFKAPEGNPGKLTFLALIKEGGANRGAFWYPNDLVLDQAAGTPAAQTVFRGNKGESCAETCSRLGGTCDAAGLTSLNSVAMLQSNVLPWLACKAPLLLACDAVGATSSEDGFCYYSSTDDCKAEGITYAAPTCGAKSTAAHQSRRLCACKGATAPTTAAPTTKAPTKATTQTTAKPTLPPGETTTAPAPVAGCDLYQGTATCPCRSDGTCDSGLKCESNKCVKDVCQYKEAGCPCELSDQSCGPGLMCDESLCVRKAILPGEEPCVAGELACPCKNGIGCVSSDLVCTEGGFCARQATVCSPGAYGCPCVQGTCAAADLVCFESENVCTKRIVPDGQGEGSTSAAAGSFTAAAVALLALFAVLF